MLRPGVVWFGENLPDGIFDAAAEAVGKSDVLIVAGTSAVVYPAAMLAPVAALRGVTVIEVNPEATDVSDHVTIALRGPSGEVLPQILQP
jgi:NAD-dependent deacetylase